MNCDAFPSLDYLNWQGRYGFDQGRYVIHSYLFLSWGLRDLLGQKEHTLWCSLVGNFRLELTGECFFGLPPACWRADYCPWAVSLASTSQPQPLSEKGKSSYVTPPKIQKTLRYISSMSECLSIGWPFLSTNSDTIWLPASFYHEKQDKSGGILNKRLH